MARFLINLQQVRSNSKDCKVKDISVCCLLEWKIICVGFLVVFVYICIAVGDPVIKMVEVKNPNKSI